MIIMTPDLAAGYLEMNSANRPLNVKHVEWLASIMRRGEWAFNGDSIRINKSGKLMDGQHRLSAIISCGIPQRVVVTTGIDDEAFLTIDCGRNRGASDALAIEGFKCTTALASAARFLMNIQKGFSMHGKEQAKKYTNAEILSVIKAHPHLQASAQYGQSKKARKYMGSALLSFCHYWFTQYDFIAGTSFFSQFESGEYSYKHSPVSALKEKLMDNAINSKKLDRDDKAAYVFLAFNKYMLGSQVRVLKLKKDKNEWFSLGSINGSK